MKGIDTNVLVRYILQDDFKQSKIATDFIELKCSENNPGVINGIVICELIWVLETGYEYERKDIAKVIESTLKTRQFQITESEILWQSLHSYIHSSADFADHYIAYLNAKNNCQYTVTFDKKAARSEHFKLLS